MLILFCLLYIAAVVIVAVFRWFSSLFFFVGMFHVKTLDENVVKSDAKWILLHFQLKHARNIPAILIFTAENLIKWHFFPCIIFALRWLSWNADRVCCWECLFLNAGDECANVKANAMRGCMCWGLTAMRMANGRWRRWDLNQIEKPKMLRF